MSPSEPASSSKIASLKRTAESEDTSSAQPQKIAKVHPLFIKPDPSSAVKSPFQWLPSIGTPRTCLHGTHLAPSASSKVAAFDLDGTVIKPNLKNKDKLEWGWWSKEVPARMRKAHAEGYAVVLVSNQGIKPKQLEIWKKKVPLIAAAISDIPFHIFAATAKDVFRKPLPGIWDALITLFAKDDVQIDKSTSFFVGDAAGRKGDFAGTDRKWAENVGIQFYTPEEYFLDRPPQPYTLTGFHPRSLSPVCPTIPIIPAHSEIVLFAGSPCFGKSTFFRRYFADQRYVHVNQDILGSRPKCVKAVEECITDGGKCVVDNTNRDAETRKFYVDIAKRLRVPIRCFIFEGSPELAWHNNLYRAYNLTPAVAAKEPKRPLLPYTALTSFRTSWEEPSVAEGFASVERVPWFFEGGEEERQKWEMWLQIDGK